MRQSPLEITAKIGPREWKLCLTAFGVYKAIHEYDWGSEELDISEVLNRLKIKKRVTVGDVLKVQIEEVWFAVLYYEDISLKEFLSQIHADEMGELQSAWKRMKAWQGDILEDTEGDEETETVTETEEEDDGKKKHEPELSSTESGS